MKYARNMSREAKIDIRASMQNREGETYLWLEVLDNGPGFSDEVLQVLQQKAQPFLMGGSTSESLMSDSGWNCYMQAKRKFTWKIGLTAAHM